MKKDAKIIELLTVARETLEYIVNCDEPILERKLYDAIRAVEKDDTNQEMGSGVTP